MNKQVATQFSEAIMERIDIIENVIAQHLGIEMDLVPSVEGRYDYVVYLNEKGDASKKVLTSHPILAQMFKDAKVYLRCWDCIQNKHAIAFDVKIMYDHNFRGGSNGTELMMFAIDTETNKVFNIQK